MTALDVAALGVALVIMMVGFLGSVLPGIPGPPLILAAAVVHKLVRGDAGASGWVIAVLTLMTGLSLALDFIATFRDALFAAGWQLIGVTKREEPAVQTETVNVAASYAANGRLIFARMSQEPDGPYHVNVADVGAEDWTTALANDCRIRAHSIQFDLDRATLRPEATPTLEKLAATLAARTAPAVEVQGHSDNIGPAGDAARQRLSETRARAVVAWLVEHGVPAAKLSSQGYGKTRPIAANDSDLGRALNRRIEIVRPGCGR